MEVKRIDKPKEDDSLYFRDLEYGETFILAFTHNYNAEDQLVYMKCFGTKYENERNTIRLCDGYLSCVKGDVPVKKVNGKFVYSLEEGDEANAIRDNC